MFESRFLSSSIFLKRAESVLTMRLSSSSATAKEASKKRRTWALIRRLMLLPLAFALLHVPGSIRRTANLTKFVATFYSFECALPIFLSLDIFLCLVLVFLFAHLCLTRALAIILNRPSHFRLQDHFLLTFVVVECYSCKWCTSVTMQTIQGICDPSQGTVRDSCYTPRIAHSARTPFLYPMG